MDWWIAFWFVLETWHHISKINAFEAGFYLYSHFPRVEHKCTSFNGKYAVCPATYPQMIAYYYWRVDNGGKQYKRMNYRNRGSREDGFEQFVNLGNSIPIRHLVKQLNLK